MKFKRRRMALVDELREKGIRYENVLAAFDNVPRHIFVDSALADKAYQDTALPIEMGQTISQPYTVARQTELLNVRSGDKILEIGTGSGYQCAILCEMGAKVFSIERHRELYERSRILMRKLNYRPTLKADDGSLGWSAYAPYQSIVVTAGAPAMPENLIKQLEVGGCLIVPVGDAKQQVMHRITRIGEDEYEDEHFSNFKFVPLIGERGWK
ncbi:MAG: protein-L-isoaspartate(D-aspartate) O-methyltransferase [Balneolales bacterium]